MPVENEWLQLGIPYIHKTKMYNSGGDCCCFPRYISTTNCAIRSIRGNP